MGATGAVVALGAAGLLLGEQGATPGPPWMTLVTALAFTPLAWLVSRRLPGHRLGQLMSATGWLSAAATLAVAWSAVPAVAWLSQWLWWPPIALIPAMLLVFPDGRLPSRRWWVLAAALAVLSSTATLALAAAALIMPQTLLSTVGQPLPTPVRALTQLALVAIAGVLCATVGVFASLVSRWRRSVPIERLQLLCLAPAALLLVVGIVLAIVGVPGGWLPAVVALPIGFTVAILQYQLHDLDLYVYRGLVWVGLTGAAVALYAVATAGLGELMGGASTAVAVVAGAVCAAALLPLERTVQRALDRLVYGHSHDGYGVLLQVGRHFAVVGDPLQVLPRFAATVVDTLRVPYAAIVIATEPDEDPLIVTHGRGDGEPVAFAMVSHGVAVGELLVQPRRPGARFSAGECRLLQGLAGQAAVAAESCRTALKLQRARERLVLAREEERRQLRRDLHDGVASSLAGAQLLTARLAEEVDPTGRSSELLSTLGQDLATCTEEMRNLIDGLRPAILDAGLVKAVEDVVYRRSASLPIALSITGDLDELPAVVEVVTLRMVSECLSNAIRHAEASRAWVSLERDERALIVEVGDDGTGLVAAGTADRRGGVGLGSIRSRVEEAGGELTIGSSPCGLRCRAMLPITLPITPPDQ